LNSQHHDCLVSRDKVYVGLPADALLALSLSKCAVFFARHLDSFIVTRNFTAVYLDLVPFRNFTVTRNLQPSTRTGKKRGTATPRLKAGQAPGT
jgi:hypothetical protein